MSTEGIIVCGAEPCKGGDGGSGPITVPPATETQEGIVRIATGTELQSGSPGTNVVAKAEDTVAYRVPGNVHPGIIVRADRGIDPTANGINTGDYAIITGYDNHSNSGDYTLLLGRHNHTTSGDYAIIAGNKNDHNSGDYMILQGDNSKYNEARYSIINGLHVSRNKGNHSLYLGKDIDSNSGDYSVIAGLNIDSNSGDYNVLIGKSLLHNEADDSIIVGENIGYNTGNGAVLTGKQRKDPSVLMGVTASASSNTFTTDNIGAIYNTCAVIPTVTVGGIIAGKVYIADYVSVTSGTEGTFALRSDDGKVVDVTSDITASDSLAFKTGVINTADYAVMFGADNGGNTGTYAFTHGYSNYANSADYAIILGSSNHHNSGKHTLIVGSINYKNKSSYSIISGSSNYKNSGSYNVISGHLNINTSGNCNTISGYYNASNSGSYSTISGHYNASNSASYSLISGFSNEYNAGDYITVSGYENNGNYGAYTTISGKYSNGNLGSYSIINHESDAQLGRFRSNVSIKASNNSVHAYGCSDGDIVVFAQDVDVFTAGTPYYVINATSSTFNLSSTPGGSIININSDKEYINAAMNSINTGDYVTLTGVDNSFNRGNHASLRGSNNYNNKGNYATISGDNNHDNSGDYSLIHGHGSTDNSGNYCIIQGENNKNNTGHHALIMGENNRRNKGSYVIVTGKSADRNDLSGAFIVGSSKDTSTATVALSAETATATVAQLKDINGNNISMTKFGARAFTISAVGTLVEKDPNDENNFLGHKGCVYMVRTGVAHTDHAGNTIVSPLTSVGNDIILGTSPEATISVTTSAGLLEFEVETQHAQNVKWSARLSFVDVLDVNAI